jgi:RHS repeat-associated protein
MIAAAGYTWDAVNRPAQRQSVMQGVPEPILDQYLHERIDQLVGVKYEVRGGVPARDVQYQYDRVGNRRVLTDNGVPVSYTVNNMNQYTTVGGQPLSYDANGNLTSMPGLMLQYDSWNRLISAATESNLVLFAYDGRNRCVKRVEIQNGLGRTTIMIWGHELSQGWELLEERGANGELIARHVHGPSVDDLVLSELGGAVYYYHHDHLNSTIAVTDESANVVEQYRYDVYGQPYFYGPDGTPRAESALGLRFLFTGREWRSSLALYDCRHRAYSPSLGRFLQMDPLGFAAGKYDFMYYSRGLDRLRNYGPLAEICSAMLLNPYSYVLNSPLHVIDPLGAVPEWLKNFLSWLKTVAGYLCPSPAGELVGALECGPGLYEIAIREKLRHELIDAMSKGDVAKVEEIQKKMNDLNMKLKR